MVFLSFDVVPSLRDFGTRSPYASPKAPAQNLLRLGGREHGLEDAVDTEALVPHHVEQSLLRGVIQRLAGSRAGFLHGFLCVQIGSCLVAGGVDAEEGMGADFGAVLQLKLVIVIVA